MGQRPGPYDEFWSDTFVMWETLWQYGWKDGNIFVLFGYGEDWDCYNPRYWGYQYNVEPWFIASITDDQAYYQDVVDIFNYLDEIMTEEDFLFVWTFDHGDQWPGGSTLELMGEEYITDEEFAEIMPDQYSRRVFWMQQCFSGGFIDDLHNENTVILTACAGNQFAGPADDIDPDGDDPLENEYYPPENDYYTHGEFNYHVFNAARYETIAYFNFLWEPDLNLDGFTSICEIKEWHFLKESKLSETPQYSDDGEIGDLIFLDILPYAPQNLALENVNNQCHLTWDPNLEYDLDHYHVYRWVTTTDQGTIPEPGTWPLIGETEENEFTDPEFAPIPGGPETALYRVTAVDEKGQESDYSDPVGSHGYLRPQSQGAMAIWEISPDDFAVRVHPNPFNPVTTLNFTLPEEAQVDLKVYDLSGRAVASLFNGWCEAGTYNVHFEGYNLPSGVYIYHLEAGGYLGTGKIILAK